LVSFWFHFCFIFVSFWFYFGFILVSFWFHFGLIGRRLGDDSDAIRPISPTTLVRNDTNPSLFLVFIGRSETSAKLTV
jgi:hypothetical protein